MSEAREECKLTVLSWMSCEPRVAATDLRHLTASNHRDCVARAVGRMLNEDELRDALLLVFANKQVRLISSSSRTVISPQSAALVR